jgi:hypothetical protein
VIFLTADGTELGRFHQYVGPAAFKKVLDPAAAAVRAR